MSNVVSYNAKKITSGNVSKTNINFSSTINDYTTSTSFEMEQVNSPSELDLNMFTNTNDSSNVFFDGLKSISDAILSTGASVANTAVAITQGVGEFGEALVDGVATIGTAGASIGTGVYDGIKYVYSKITGADFSSTTKAMWNNEKEFVAKEHVKDAYTNFHENNIIGKTLDEHSFSLFKSTGAAYQVANRVGYIGGVVALSAVTAGAGSALTGTSLASTSVASLSAGSATVNISANSLLSGGITAVAGLGKNSSKAWNDGASTTEGLAYGIATGAWEGLEMAFGSAINSLKLGIGSGIQEQLVNTGAHVALDSIDGATSAFIEPLLQTMITPNSDKIEDILKLVNYDKNGNQINNKTWDDLNILEKWNALFKYNGGVKTVAVDGISAGIFSLASEIPDILKVVRKDSLSNTEIEDVVIKETESSSSIKKESIENEQISKENMIEETVQKEQKEIVDEAVKENRNFDYSQGEYKERKVIEDDDGVATEVEVFFPEMNETATDKFFSSFETYGQNQGSIKAKLMTLSPEESLEFVTELKKKFLDEKFPNLSLDDAYRYLSEIDASNNGCCTYASTISQILDIFKDNIEELENILGYKIYNIVDDKKVLNNEWLLMDLYSCANDKNRIKLVDGVYQYNYDKTWLKDTTAKLMPVCPYETYYDTPLVHQAVLKKFFESKGASVEVKDKCIFTKNKDFINDRVSELEVLNVLEDGEINYDKVLTDIRESLAKNESVVIGADRTNINYNIKFEDGKLEGRSDFISSGHSMCVTGTTKSGHIIVDTWGEKRIITKNEIMAHPEDYRIFSTSIKLNPKKIL